MKTKTFIPIKFWHSSMSGIASLLCLIGALASSAHGAVTYCSDRSAFLAAITNATLFNVNFAGANTNGVNSYTAYFSANGVTLSNVNFNGINANGTTHETSFIGPGWSPSSGPKWGPWTGNPTTLQSDYRPGFTVVTLPVGTVAVGFNCMTEPPGGSIQVSFPTGAPFTIGTGAKPTPAFAGFISDVPIDPLRFEASGGGYYPFMCNFIFARETTPRLSIRASQVEIGWDSLAGVSYQVQYRSDLTTNIWTNLGGPVSATPPWNTVTDVIIPGQPHKYYQVFSLP